MCKKGAKMANVWTYVLNYWERLKKNGYMLRGVWQALNSLSIHVTLTAIVPGAYPGEAKMCLRLSWRSQMPAGCTRKSAVGNDIPAWLSWGSQIMKLTHVPLAIAILLVHCVFAVRQSYCARYSYIGWTSVRPSVCPSHAGIVSKRLNLSSICLHRIAPWF